MSDAVTQPPLTILIAALGGEGGGVLMNWIVACARAEGLPVQATSVPGVAQRTGSTSYYIEIARHAAKARQPVFALVPMPGRVDVAIASELAEAGRLMERGFINPASTVLITSTSRVLTTAEKMQMGDGRFDDERLLKAGTMMARKFIPLALDEIAVRNTTMISAAMFGALAGSGVLPFARECCEAAIGSGRSAKASLGGFADAFAAATADAPAVPAPAVAVPMPLPGVPDNVASVARLGEARCVDYQDAAYGALYLDRVRRLAAGAGGDDAMRLHALEEAARRLALWMAYEDIPRVADLKTRPERFSRIRSEAEMQPHQLLSVTEFLKPGAEELAGMLPLRLGTWLRAHAQRGGFLPFVGKGIHLRTSTILGFWSLRILAQFQRSRRGSLRYAEEQAAIEIWLSAMEDALAKAPAFAGGLAELPRVLKGYGETLDRGQTNYRAIFQTLVAPAIARGLSDADAPRLRAAMAAALADPEGEALALELSRKAA